MNRYTEAHIDAKRQRVIASLQRRDGVSATRLWKATGVSIGLVRRFLAELKEQGLVCEEQARGHNLKISLHGRGTGKRYTVYRWRHD